MKGNTPLKIEEPVKPDGSVTGRQSAVLMSDLRRQNGLAL